MTNINSWLHRGMICDNARYAMYARPLFTLSMTCDEWRSTFKFNRRMISKFTKEMTKSSTTFRCNKCYKRHFIFQKHIPPPQKETFRWDQWDASCCFMYDLLPFAYTLIRVFYCRTYQLVVVKIKSNNGQIVNILIATNLDKPF